MNNIKTLLIANRGEIAVRIIRTAKTLGIKTISIYTPVDAASLHVSQSDEAILLQGDNSSAYTDGDEIIKIAKSNNVNAIIPGYGFLSENADFARKVHDAGLQWCGPSPDVIETFGIKHTARELAEKAGVPIVPGTKGLVNSEEEAIQESERMGYPVMLKATGGGGGMGLVTCQNKEEVKSGFHMVKSRGEQLFKNSGMFIERYYPASRHIEVQVFGNGQGSVVHFGERECSIQRRHQKAIEECPSPFVQKRQGLREKLGEAAVSLAKSVHYGSAGTVEFLVDDKTGEFFFLEMNTRLQVEHGITELCYNVDLVELMLKQADAQLGENGGMSKDDLESMQPTGPRGAAIEARVYAENPIRDYAPSPGLLQKVEWATLEGSRIDTFAFSGCNISSYYDPLIAKVMYHASSREATIKGLHAVLSKSQVSGPPNNLEFLAAIIANNRFETGDTLTSFLQDFQFTPNAIDVISAGAYTLVQDLPGRPTVGMGICHSGAMDPVALSIANMLVGNEDGKEGLEITLNGPELRFLVNANIALTGASMDTTLDDEPFAMWTRKYVKAGQTLKVGRTTAGGCRAYLAVHGGFPSIADYFGSKSTSPVVAIGGMQGRALAPGDILSISGKQPVESNEVIAVPENLRPQYPKKWDVASMPGPHDDGYFTPSDLEALYNTEWQVSHNASRSAIRLNGPVPEWARKDGAEGGSHPSNVVEYGYPLYGLNWTGDNPAILVPDGPNFGGFVCSNTVVSADYWKVGQIKAGDKFQYRRCSLATALHMRKKLDLYLSGLRQGIDKNNFDDIEPLDTDISSDSPMDNSVICSRPAQGHVPQVKYRQGGDQHIIVCYADDTDHFDINNRVRVTSLEQSVTSKDAPGWLRAGLLNTVGCCNNLTLYYDCTKIDRSKLLEFLLKIEDDMGDLSTSKVPCRRINLPISFKSREQDEANKRYQETQRPYAPYLPKNFDFVAKNNAFTNDELKNCYLAGDFLTVFVGFYCGLPDAIPVDPRNRFFAPKMNPSRVFTPEGTVGLGGGAIAIYPVDSPGGYQMNGRTIPCWDYYGWKEGFSPERPWLFKDFDLIKFYEVTEEKLDEMLLQFRAGKYRFQWEDVSMDMAEHNELLKQTANEVRELRKKQSIAQDEMVLADDESLKKCREEKVKNQVDEATIEELANDAAIFSVEAPVDANVWKVQVKEGDHIKAKQVIAILEAMKLEINVNAPDDVRSGKVEKLLVVPGDQIRAGQRLALLRKEE